MNSAEPKYTVAQIEARTGVRANTLRQWERRYDVPRPARSASGYRLYSDDDIAIIEFIKDSAAKGIAVSRAAEMVRAGVKDPLRVDVEALRGGLVAALLEGQAARAERAWHEALVLTGPESAAADVLAGALREIGDRWHDGQASVAQEHFATAFAHGRLAALIELAGNGLAGNLVLATPADEHHAVGLLILEFFLRRAGYSTYALGANLPLGELRDYARGVGADAVMLGVTNASALESLAAHAPLRRFLGVRVILGGQALETDPDRARKLGAEFLGNDPREVVARLAAR
jgi:DNA-binding transcriptional MerR regulator